jgi:hypothetical protein
MYGNFNFYCFPILGKPAARDRTEHDTGQKSARSKNRDPGKRVGEKQQQEEE